VTYAEGSGTILAPLGVLVLPDRPTNHSELYEQWPYLIRLHTHLTAITVDEDQRASREKR
jgi:hypothetical protein